MQNHYSGATRRVLRRFNESSKLKIDGLIDHEEQRGVYVKQKFSLSQKRDTTNFDTMTTNWIFEDEKMNLVGGFVPFEQTHDLTDRLLLNKSFQNITFRPDNCSNFLKIDNQSQIQLAPYLTSQREFENVTRPPKVASDAYNFQEVVNCQLGAYGRVWFGSKHTMQNGTTTHTGEAPFFVANDAPVDAGNVTNYTVYGFQLKDLVTGQVLRPHASILHCGQRDKLNAVGSAINFYYDKTQDCFTSHSFNVTIPQFPINGKNHTFTVPSMSTLKNSVDTPYNYYFKQIGEDKSRRFLHPVNTINVPLAGGVPAHIDETINMKDFVPIRIGTAMPYQKAADLDIGDTIGIQDIYMFVPIFRIYKGNAYSSVARPRRLGISKTAVVAQEWLPNNATPMSDLALAANANLDHPSQVPFWANYETLRYHDRGYDKYLFDYVKVGHITLYPGGDAADTGPMTVLQFENELPENFQTQLDVIVDKVVNNRVALDGTLNVAQKEVFLLYRRTNWNAANKHKAEGYGYFRLRLDQLNTFKTAANENINQNVYDGKIAAGAPAAQAFRVAAWATHRMIQIETTAARNGKYLALQKSCFRDEHLAALAARAQPPVPLDIANAAKTSASDCVAKQFDDRSTFNFLNYLYDGGGDPGDVLPQPEGGGNYSAGNYTIFNDSHFELFIPVQQPTTNTSSHPTIVNVECTEPWFAYCSGASQLNCQYPMDYRSLGPNYPLAIQDMEYTFNQDASPLFTRGYLHDEGTELVVSNVRGPEFTMVSEKFPGVRQADKSVMKISEVTATFDSFKKSHDLGVTPTFQIEERLGMFEYLFLYQRYDVQNFGVVGSAVNPLSDPIITSIQFKVRGRENLFVREMDSSDLERATQQNCHRECNFNDIFSSGQGILLHLSDLGLTEEKPYPVKNRIQIELTVLTTQEPKEESLENRPSTVTTHVVLIRHNQLLKGDFVETRFSFLNDTQINVW